MKYLGILSKHVRNIVANPTKYIHHILFVLVILLAIYYVYGNYSEHFGSMDSISLITNGSFSGGKDIQEMTDSSASEIVLFDGPNNSSYALRQSGAALYKMRYTGISPNKTFMISMYEHLTKNWDGKDKLINIVMYKDHGNPVVITGDTRGNFEKRVKDKKGREWNKVSLIFRTPPAFNGKVDIAIGNNPQNTKGKRYVTGVQFSEFLDRASDMRITGGLLAMIDAANSNSFDNSEIWRDVSNSGNDFRWEVSPRGTETKDNILTGPKISRSVGDFTIIFRTAMTDVVTDKEVTALHIGGNQETAFAIRYHKGGTMSLVVADQVHEVDTKVITSNVNTYAFVYCKSSQKMHIYINETKIHTKSVSKIHFDELPVIINPHKEWSGKISAFLLYERKLSEKEIIELHNGLVKDLYSKGTDNSIAFGQPTTDPFVFGDVLSKSPEEEKVEKEKEEWSACPRCKIVDGHYIIRIPNGSKAASDMRYSGNIDYGTQRKIAKGIFMRNFPYCQLPNELNKHSYEGSTEMCPFSVRDGNPCYDDSCRNVDWSNKKRIPQKCKRQINSYCEKHNKYDGNCLCWRPQYRSSPECLKHRRDFADNDLCDIKALNIEEHPDFKKYIRRDNIPCWGCNP